MSATAPIVPTTVTQAGKTYLVIPPAAGMTAAQIAALGKENPRFSVITFVDTKTNVMATASQALPIAPDGSVSHNTLGTILSFVETGLKVGITNFPLPFAGLISAVLGIGIEAAIAKWGGGVKERWLAADIAGEKASLPDAL